MAAQAAWGLEVGGSATRLVRVAQAGSAWRVAEACTAVIDDRWDGRARSWRLAAAVRSRLADVQRSAEPLAICLPDGAVLYRRLHLPAADASTTHKMARAQLDVLLPGQAPTFAWGWAEDGDGEAQDGRHVWLCAVRREQVQAALAQGAVDGRPPRVVPTAPALASAYGRLFRTDGTDETDAARLLLILVAARGATAMVLAGGRLVRCEVFDEAIDSWIERLAERAGTACADVERCLLDGRSPAGIDGPMGDALASIIADWTSQLHDLVDGPTPEGAAASGPQRCVLLGRGRHVPGLADAVARVLKIPVVADPQLRPAWQGDGVDADMASAIAAALSILEPAEPVIRLGGGEPEATTGPVPRRLPRVRLALVAWLVLALAALYGAQWWQTTRMRNAEQAIGITSTHEAALDRRLAIGSYLHLDGTPPLAILHELSELTPATFVIDNWTYARGGALRVKGIAPNAAELATFLETLSGARCVRAANLVNQEIADPKKKTLKFEIDATVGPWRGPVRREQEPPDRNEDQKKDREADAAADGAPRGPKAGTGSGPPASAPDKEPAAP